MARPLMLFAAAATLALLASPAAAQSAGDAGLRYLSWPGRPAQTATLPPSAEAYGLRGEAEITRTGGAPSARRPDRYSGGGDGQSLEARYYQRRQAQSGAVRPEEPRYEEPRYEAPPQPRPDLRTEARYDAPPPRLTQPTYQPQPEPRPQQRYEQQQPAQTIQIQPPASGYAPRPEPQQQAQQEPQPQPTSDPRTGTATPSDSVRYYSVHREAGRQPDPIAQTYVSAEDAMVALSPPSGTSLAERQRQATAEETALDLIRQLPPEQLALLLDTPQ